MHDVPRHDSVEPNGLRWFLNLQMGSLGTGSFQPMGWNEPVPNEPSGRYLTRAERYLVELIRTLE